MHAIKVLESDFDNIGEHGLMKCIVNYQHFLSCITQFVMFLVFIYFIFYANLTLVLDKDATNPERDSWKNWCMSFSVLFYIYELA